MKSIVYILETITNLHVGNGDINYNIIDNEVEKDLNGYPIINSSGVKGAFREFIHESGIGEKDEEKIFGSKSSNNDEEKKPGKLKFYSGECLAITMRNEVGDKPYSLVTTIEMLKRFIEMCEVMKVTDLKVDIKGLDENKTYKVSKYKINVEGINIENQLDSKVKDLFEMINEDTAKNLVIMPCENIKDISLPVLARNVLENGISKNIWYEEYVPYHSLFFVCVNCEDDDLLNKFDAAVDNEIVQFGGNATIGYGLTRIKSLAKGGDKNG